MRLFPVFHGEVRPGSRAFTGEPLARTLGAELTRLPASPPAPLSHSSEFQRRCERPGIVPWFAGTRHQFG